MNEGIKVVSILGEDYSIKAPAGEDATLVSAVTLLFFFQAEDGIRDVAVTGVQTCALPISAHTL